MPTETVSESHWRRLDTPGKARLSPQGNGSILSGVANFEEDGHPATPMRRLNVPVGQKATVTTAWLNLPAPMLTLLTQEYERVGEKRYNYRAGDFTAKLRVRDTGIVTEYSALWKEDQG